MTEGLDLEASASLGLSVGRLVSSIEASRAAQQRAQRSVMWMPVKPHSVAVVSEAVTILSHEHDLGPSTGYAWAVQRLCVGGLSSGDLITLYKGPSSSFTVDPTNEVQVFTSTTPAWVPGRTGLILYPGDSLVFSGTGLQATTVAVSGEVIQLEQWVMPDFLL
jgi:hypothetical protein